VSPATLGCRFFRTATGTEPVREWLRGLDETGCKQIGHDILRVQWRWPVSRPLVGAMGEGIYEVRSTSGKREFRVLFYIAGSAMVLLHGFQKKTQATPKAELALAKTRKREDRDE
jgi:phage-related protein